MPRLALWSAPKDEDVTETVLFSSQTREGDFVEVARLDALDPYRNWVTHYVDEAQDLVVTWYRAQHYKPDPTGLGTVLTEVGVPYRSEDVYPLTPQDVLDVIPGIPLSSINASLVQKRIQEALAFAQTVTRTRLQPTLVTRERYDYRIFNQIIGRRTGSPVQLRHFPVLSIQAVEYQVRGSVDQGIYSFGVIDKKVMLADGASDYNRGLISVWPLTTNIQGLFAGMELADPRYRHAIDVLISYTHGYPEWPADIRQGIAEIVAASIMEIAGEALTAGISSRSVDGYSESYTASATTTIFSARRIYYEDKFKKLLTYYRKPIWA